MALVFKVGTLFIKTASKPLAGRFQKWVLGHPTYRKKVIDLAQYLHRAEVAINRGAEGKTGRYFVANISEERALELASKFVSESFLFSVGLGILVLEYKRGERKDEAKKKKEEDFRRQLDEGVHRDREALRSEMMTIQAMMEAMMIRLEDLERRLDHPDQGGGSGSRSKMFGIL
mmetsp:Transcript_2069/g.6124  ORF Transcript_2069/g.6124 Transcript_2069/m.6124 type:complete len:174 (-) Transcript_2069:3645-4166(-)